MSATMQQPPEVREFQVPATAHSVGQGEINPGVQSGEHELGGIQEAEQVSPKELFNNFETAMPWLDQYGSLEGFEYAAVPIDATKPGVFNFIVELGSDPESVAGYSLRGKPAYKRAEYIALQRGWPTPENVSEKLKSHGFDGDKVQFDDLPRDLQEEVYGVFQLMSYCVDVKDHVLDGNGKVISNYISG